MKRKNKLWLALLLSCSLLVSACSSQTSDKAGSDGTLVVGLEAEPTTLDAHQLSDYNSSRAAMELYDQLVKFKDESTELEPDLAEKWDISEDGKEYTFHLRQDVKFHDGTPFNAEAVKFSIERQTDSNHPYHDTGTFAYADFTFGPVEKVEVVDEFTVKITLKEPFAPFLSNMAMHAASIVSPTALEKHSSDFTMNPVGTGPFKFVSWNKGVEVVLEKNEDYFGGAPSIDQLIFKPITEAQTRLAELESGNIDLIVNIPPDDLERLRGDSNLQVIEQAGMHVWWTALNTQKEPFNNVKVRQAVNYAINKEAIVDGILQGTGELANSPVPPTVWGHNPDVKNYPYNPEKAKELLAEAGYADGFDVTYWVPESGSGMQQPQAMAAAIQSDLAKVGINVEIQTLEWGAYLDKVFVPQEDNDMDMHQMSWIGDNGDPDNFLYILLSGEQWPTNGFNDAYYQNDRVDELLKEARITKDKGQRTAMYEEAQELIMEDAPWVIIDHEKQIVVANSSVKNFKLHPTGVFRFSSVTLD
ncbi:peptide/nickel transport system substrate-binding protein [Bacillus mesophilus]|uniref:ABC transporter substrate-binding protein n=1 Tax=Bacillus mesophilus TaxID=1808955 RepID=A0A6M0Q9Z3_9BACI|nr:ABC transporter substrate-binding protein [Bacillus mesophilus]MBM7661678.1 peptide/nickel transport system substrate-binding protein [Bacillus mesophilus]NEY72340.1 ABC transporter substrate-binding protein [Bacillus mesophilus]